MTIVTGRGLCLAQRVKSRRRYIFLEIYRTILLLGASPQGLGQCLKSSNKNVHNVQRLK